MEALPTPCELFDPLPRLPARADQMPAAFKRISVVSPVYGCKTCLEDLVDRVALSLRSAYASEIEIMLVDDASPDNAWESICALAKTRPWLKALRLSRNFGQHYAISAGIEAATGDVVIVMDCDLQDVPEEIPKLIDALNDGVEVAFAQRVERRDTFLKRLGSWTFFWILTWLTGVKQDHSTANFGAFTRKVIDAVNSMPENHRCFPLMVKWTGFRTRLVPVRHAPRVNGKSGYSFSKLARLGLDIVLSYSDKPLRLVVKVGLIFSTVAVAIVLLSIYKYFNGNIAVAGFTSIIASIWLLGGVSVFCIGVTGLYVGRIFRDTKRRPYYLTGEHINMKGTTP